MTPRDRILTALRHEPPDRTPTDGWFHPEVMVALKRHLGCADREGVLAHLGIEGWSSLTPTLWFEAFEAAATMRPQAGDAAAQTAGEPVRMSQSWEDAANEHERAIWLDADRHEDAWGIRWRLGEGGRYAQWLDGPLAGAGSAQDVEAYAYPTAEAVRVPGDYGARVAELKKAGNYVSCDLENPFKRFWHLRGYENALMDYLADADIVAAVYDRLFDLIEHMAHLAAGAGVDMIKCIGDVAMQDRIIMGPDLWRRIDKPRWAAFIQSVRRVNRDITFFFHSDGMLTPILDDLVDVGFTVINPIQPECMDPVAIKRRFGSRITLHGGISLQRTLPFGSEADVRDEVASLIRACGLDGGLVAMPSNVIQPDTPVANIVACFHAARDLDVRGPGARS